MIPIQPASNNLRAIQTGSSLAPQTATSGGDLGGGGSQEGGGQGLTVAPSEPQQAQEPSARIGDLGSYTGGPLASSLLAGSQSSVDRSADAIKTLGSAFRESAGPSRNYDTSGAQSVLQSAIRPEASAADKGAARQLLGARYEGPQGFDPAAVSQLKQLLGGESGVADPLRTGGGLQSAVLSTVPGLTPGQAAMEAQRLRYNDKFQGAAVNQAQQLSGLQSSLGQGANEAEAFAQQRAKEEAGIAEKSRQFLTDQGAQLRATLEGQLGAQRDQDAATQQKLLKLRESGQLGDIPDEYRDQIAGSAGRKESEAALEAYKAIMAKYSDLEGIDPLEKIITKRGKEWYGQEYVDPKGKDKGETKLKDIRKIKGIDKAKERRLVERQRELEGLFGLDLGRKDDKEDTLYRDVANLDLRERRDGGGAVSFEDSVFKPGDYGSYFSFRPSAGLTIGNLASEDQLQTFNNINELLDNADRLERSGDVFQAGKIVADVDRYLKDEEARLEERGENVDQAEKDWRKKVKRARARYKRSKAKELGELVGQVVGGVAGAFIAGQGYPIGQAGGYLGGEIGAGLAGE